MTAFIKIAAKTCISGEHTASDIATLGTMHTASVCCWGSFTLTTTNIASATTSAFRRRVINYVTVQVKRQQWSCPRLWDCIFVIAAAAAAALLVVNRNGVVVEGHGIGTRIIPTFIHRDCVNNAGLACYDCVTSAAAAATAAVIIAGDSKRWVGLHVLCWVPFRKLWSLNLLPVPEYCNEGNDRNH